MRFLRSSFRARGPLLAAVLVVATGLAVTPASANPSSANPSSAKSSSANPAVPHSVGVLSGAPTSEEPTDIYRYWGYFTAADGEYAYAQTGPADATPADGSVEAYRYAAPADPANPVVPRADLAEVDFDAVCGDEDAGDDEKRVAVILDYGVEADAEGAEVPAPEADCAVVADDASGMRVLEAVEDVRVESGLVCAIGEYPATGCSEIVDQGTPGQEETVEFAVDGTAGEAADSADGTNATDDAGGTGGLIAIGAVILALIVGALVMLRRRSSA